MSAEVQVRSEVKDGVMTITFDNPEMKNGLDWIGVNQLADCYERMRDDPSIRVAVVTGNDEWFYTGGRVDPNAPGEQKKYADAIARVDALAAANKVPMIAAISGHCLKAGMGMLAQCDFAIAREGVEFGFPEVRMGGVPMMVMVSTIDTMPRKRAMEAYLTSWNFSAQDAYMMGLVNRVVPKEEFWPTVDKFVHVFLDTPPILVELTRRAYDNLSRIQDPGERAVFGMKMLREECLPAMTQVKTEYNV